jgi:hypothetical protein
MYGHLDPPIKDPVGLAFTPSSILASWCTPLGSIEVINGPATLAFRKHYEDTVRDYATTAGVPGPKPVIDEDLDDITAMLKEAIAPLTVTLTERLSHTPIYTSPLLPSTCEHLGYRSSLQKIPEIHGLYFIGRASTALCSCWDFFNGANIHHHGDSMPPNPGPVNMVLVLEYEQDYVVRLSTVSTFMLQLQEGRPFCSLTYVFAFFNEICDYFPFRAQYEHMSRNVGSGFASSVAMI